MVWKTGGRQASCRLQFKTACMGGGGVCKQSSYATIWDPSMLLGGPLWPTMNYRKLQGELSIGQCREGRKGQNWSPFRPVGLAGGAPPPPPCDSHFPAQCCLLPAQEGAGRRGKKRHSNVLKHARFHPRNAPKSNHVLRFIERATRLLAGRKVATTMKTWRRGVAWDTDVDTRKSAKGRHVHNEYEWLCVKLIWQGLEPTKYTKTWHLRWEHRAAGGQHWNAQS